jgi:hypothetical protein
VTDVDDSTTPPPPADLGARRQRGRKAGGAPRRPRQPRPPAAGRFSPYEIFDHLTDAKETPRDADEALERLNYQDASKPRPRRRVKPTATTAAPPRPAIAHKQPPGLDAPAASDQPPAAQPTDPLDVDDANPDPILSAHPPLDSDVLERLRHMHQAEDDQPSAPQVARGSAQLQATQSAAARARHQVRPRRNERPSRTTRSVHGRSGRVPASTRRRWTVAGLAGALVLVAVVVGLSALNSSPKRSAPAATRSSSFKRAFAGSDPRSTEHPTLSIPVDTTLRSAGRGAIVASRDLLRKVPKRARTSATVTTTATSTYTAPTTTQPATEPTYTPPQKTYTPPPSSGSSTGSGSTSGASSPSNNSGSSSGSGTKSGTPPCEIGALGCQ